MQRMTKFKAGPENVVDFPRPAAIVTVCAVNRQSHPSGAQGFNLDNASTLPFLGIFKCLRGCTVTSKWRFSFCGLSNEYSCSSADDVDGNADVAAAIDQKR
jgi:hypothetical protein